MNEIKDVSYSFSSSVIEYDSDEKLLEANYTLKLKVCNRLKKITLWSYIFKIKQKNNPAVHLRGE